MWFVCLLLLLLKVQYHIAGPIYWFILFPLNLNLRKCSFFVEFPNLYYKNFAMVVFSIICPLDSFFARFRPHRYFDQFPSLYYKNFVMVGALCMNCLYIINCGLTVTLINFPKTLYVWHICLLDIVLRWVIIKGQTPYKPAFYMRMSYLVWNSCWSIENIRIVLWCIK